MPQVAPRQSGWADSRGVSDVRPRLPCPMRHIWVAVRRWDRVVLPGGVTIEQPGLS